MKQNHRLFISIILTLALVISLLNAAGVFDKSEILITKAEYSDEIDIYIVGEVKNPGIYSIKKGSILNDLVEMAGGLTQSVDAHNINLAYRLDKNMMIRIRETSMLLLDDTTGITINDESMIDVVVNINTADVSELSRLPGIGEATAKTIIDYRTINGEFETIFDIMKVSGIKEAKFETIRDFITVD